MNRAELKEYWMAAHHQLCPNEEDWLAYRQGTLSESHRGVYTNHLAGCAACRELLADMEGFFAEQNPVPPEMVEADLRATLKRVASEPGAEPAPIEKVVSIRAGRPYAWMAVAAASALALLGQALWMARVRQGWEAERGSLQKQTAQLEQSGAQARDLLAELRRPASDTVVLDLRPAGAVVRAGSGQRPGTVNVSTKQPAILIVTGMPGQAFEWQLRDGAATVVYQGMASYNSTGSLTLTLPSGALVPGVYRLVLIEKGTQREFAPALNVTEPAKN